MEAKNATDTTVKDGDYVLGGKHLVVTGASMRLNRGIINKKV